MSEAQGQGKQSLVEMLKAMVQARASDIHLQAGAPPTVRIDGKLRPFGNRPLTPKEVEAIARALLTPEQLEELEYRKEMDFAYTIPGVARFRCNLLRQRGSFGLVMRVVSEVIPSFEALGLPREVMEGLAAERTVRGFALYVAAWAHFLRKSIMQDIPVRDASAELVSAPWAWARGADAASRGAAEAEGSGAAGAAAAASVRHRRHHGRHCHHDGAADV